MVDEWLLSNTKWAIYSYIMARTSFNRWDDDIVKFVLDQQAELDFDSASWLKQQSAWSLWHISLIPNHPVFAVIP